MQKNQNGFQIVAKFGGTSVGELPRLRMSAKIILENPAIQVVVVSALSGTTNKLIQIWHNLHDVAVWSTILLSIRERHLSYLTELQASEQTTEEVEALLGDLEMLLHRTSSRNNIASPALGDEILSFGERLGSLIMCEALNQELKSSSSNLNSKSNSKLRNPTTIINFDVRKIMITDSHFGEATPNLSRLQEKTETELLPLITNTDSNGETVIVTQGFLGSDPDGVTTTLGRGGSDYSAALIARVLMSSELQIWTDVDGIYSVDPRLVPEEAKSIPEISYPEAAELAYWGAKVLHPLTLIPTIEVGIPVYVGDSLKGGRKGTLVTSANEKEKNVSVRALTLRNNQSIVTLSRIKKPQQYGYLAPIFSLLAKHHISIDQITTSEISTSFTLQNPHLLSDEVIAELHHFADVHLEKNLSLISVIGPHLTRMTPTLAEIMNLLKNFTVRGLFMGASETNFSFLVPADQSLEIIKVLHHHFLH